jgi:CHAT domain-containing protein
LAVSRPSTANRSEAPPSEPWWKAEEFAEIQKTSAALRAAGDFAALEPLYLRGVEVARQAGRREAESSYWGALGNVYVYLLRYAEAVEAYQHARELATAAGDWLAAGAVAPGLSSVYYLVGDLPSARRAVDDGLAAVARLGSHPYYEAQLKLQRARLYPATHQDILYAIEQARLQGNLALEAEGWDVLGEQALGRADLASAEAAFGEAHRLRLLHQPADLRLSYWRLGALRLAQGRSEEAARWTRRALEANRRSPSALLESALPHQLGQILLAQGDTLAALEQFGAAAAAAAAWRERIPVFQPSLDAADAALDRKVFRSYIETAAREALQSGRSYWAKEAFLTVERNRAAGLRSLPKKWESFLTQDSLSDFQQGLGDSELFLSFYTGAAESYLWAVTRVSLHLYRLPAAPDLERSVREFEDAILGDQPEHRALAERLYQDLFGQLSAAEAGKKRWLLSLEGCLFHLPFAALRVDGAYLVERASLQVTPGAAFLQWEQKTNAGGYLGVGDPIYNWADPRARSMRWRRGGAPERTSGQLSRLVASGEEVVQSAENWPGARTLLMGAAASLQQLRESLTREPRVIHLATHMVAEQPAQAAVALTLSPTGGPELLGPAEVAQLRVPQSLVVMTGCASGAGEVWPGAGLLGLTRTWLLAGASAVVTTAWPIEDVRGDFMPAFLREYASGPAAAALQRAQIAMIHSGTWQSNPAYWAAFRLTGGVR